MKNKFIAILVILVVAVAFVGCGGEAAAKKNEAEKLAEQTQEIMGDTFYDWSWDEESEILSIVIVQPAPLGDSKAMKDTWAELTGLYDEHCISICDSADIDECPIDVEMIVVDEEDPDIVTYKTLNGKSKYNIMD